MGLENYEINEKLSATRRRYGKALKGWQRLEYLQQKWDIADTQK